jgi:hypothetical protein
MYIFCQFLNATHPSFRFVDLFGVAHMYIPDYQVRLFSTRLRFEGEISVFGSWQGLLLPI